MTRPDPDALTTRHDVGDTLTAVRGLRRGTIARDGDGDEWRYGRTRWSCMAPIDGQRVTRVARLGTGDLIRIYGPLVVTGFLR